MDLEKKHDEILYEFKNRIGDYDYTVKKYSDNLRCEIIYYFEAKKLEVMYKLVEKNGKGYSILFQEDNIIYHNVEDFVKEAEKSIK